MIGLQTSSERSMPGTLEIRGLAALLICLCTGFGATCTAGGPALSPVVSGKPQYA